MLDLIYADEPSRGKCNVVFVGIVPTAAQKLQLQDYSRNFKVRGHDTAPAYPPWRGAERVG